MSDAFNSGSWNPYSYVSNSPLSSIDPTGFAQCDRPSGTCGGGGGPNPFDGEGGSDSGRYTHDTGGGDSDLGGPGVHGKPYAPWSDPKPAVCYVYDCSSRSSSQGDYNLQTASFYRNEQRRSDNLGNFADGFDDRPRYSNAVIVGGPAIGGLWSDDPIGDARNTLSILWDVLTAPPPTQTMCAGSRCWEEPTYGGTPPFGPGTLRTGAQLLRKAPLHHICTNENCVSFLRGGPWTPRFEKLFKSAGMKLQDGL